MVAGLGPVTIDKFRRSHAPLALELNFDEFQRRVVEIFILAAADLAATGKEARSRHRDFSRPKFIRILHGSSALHLQRFTLEGCECSGPGLKTAQTVEKVSSTAGEVHAAIFFFQNRRERGL